MENKIKVVTISFLVTIPILAMAVRKYFELTMDKVDLHYFFSVLILSTVTSVLLWRSSPQPYNARFE